MSIMIRNALWLTVLFTPSFGYSFMQSGGFSPSSKVPKINSPALVLWGRQDGILDGTEFANKVRIYLSRDVELSFL